MSFSSMHNDHLDPDRHLWPDEESETTALVCEVDFDEAQYLGSEEDGVYFDAKKHENGQWFMSATVDCETSNFTASLVQDDGPYASFEEAMEAGINAAVEWCVDNDVALDDAEIDAIREAIHLDANFAD